MGADLTERLYTWRKDLAESALRLDLPPDFMREYNSLVPGAPKHCQRAVSAVASGRARAGQRSVHWRISPV